MNLQQTFKPLVNFRSATPQTVGSSWFGGLFGNAITKNGTLVNNKSALTLSAFFNAVDIISNDYAKLPKHVYQKTSEGRTKLSSHPVQTLLSVAPNQYQLPFLFDKTILIDAILKGNGYAEIERNAFTGKPQALQYINQEKHAVEVFTKNGKLWYKFNGKTVASDDMYHIPGFSLNGITGVGVVAFAANSLGTSLSSQEFGSDYYKTKGVGVGVLETDKKLDPGQKVAYSGGFNSAMSKTGQWKSAVLDEGMKYNNLTITAQEAAFLETNKEGIAEVGRWLNIPLHKLKLLDNVNNSITEQLELGYLADSVIPWMLKFEQESTRKLFTPSEISTNHYVKANEGALLRADKRTQAEYFSKLIFAGVYTRNEVRQLLDMNKLNGLDEPLTPVNTQIMDMVDAQLKKLESETQNNE